MGEKHSEMLDPLTDLVGESGKTKTTKKNKTKKKPWRWDLICQQVFDNVRAAIAKEVLLAYPDFLKHLRLLFIYYLCTVPALMKLVALL
jgi:hypothetical protein